MKTRLIKRLNRKFRRHYKIVKVSSGYEICERKCDGHIGYLDWMAKYQFLDKESAFDCLNRIRHDFITDVVKDMRIQSSRID